MSRRVLPIGLIINQKQSNTGAPLIGGVGAKPINIRNKISRKVSQIIIEKFNIPQITGSIINNGISIYLNNHQRNINYEVELTYGSNTIINKVSFKFLKGKFYTNIKGLTNGTTYTVRLRGYNIFEERSEWSSPINLTPQINQYSYTTGTYSINIPLDTQVSYLVVGGGGGGGAAYDTGESGGGGGGMVITGTFTSLEETYSIIVGNGGAAGIGSSSNPRETDGSDGENSSIVGIVNSLGGKGGKRSRSGPYETGGAAANPSLGIAAEGGSGGGNAAGSNSGGGGGSSGNGGNGSNSGGAGTNVEIGSITGVFGVGGSGVNNGVITTPVNGASNTGNGGSGASTGSSNQTNGGIGGSGFVVLVY